MHPNESNCGRRDQRRPEEVQHKRQTNCVRKKSVIIARDSRTAAKYEHCRAISTDRIRPSSLPSFCAAAVSIKKIATANVQTRYVGFIAFDELDDVATKYNSTDCKHPSVCDERITVVVDGAVRIDRFRFRTFGHSSNT